MSTAVRFWQLLSAVQTHFKTAERWQAKLRARTASNFKLRLAMLLLLSLINVVVGAFLYRTAAGEDWMGSLFTVYSVLYNVPGSDITSAPTLLGTVVLNLIFIFGLLVFATILAMITEEVNSVLLAARSGKAPLAMSGHILLLNWNNQVSFILDQLEQAQLGDGSHPFAGRPVVILADKDKEEMDALVVGVLKTHELEVHTRTGKPYKLEHLERVSAADAAAVLVLHPESSDASDGGGDDNSSVSDIGAAAGADDNADSAGASALKMQTIMALSSQLLGKKAAIVVQVPESSPDDGSSQLQLLDQVLMMAGHPSHLLNLPVKKMVHSLAIQTAIQPWSATVYNHILQQGLQPALTFMQLPQSLCGAGRSSTSTGSVLSDSDALSGTDSVASSFSDPAGSAALYGDVRAHYAADLLVIGFISGRSKKLYLNPHESSRLRLGDTLVTLRRGGSKVPSDRSVTTVWRRVVDAALLRLAGLKQGKKRKAKGGAAVAGAAAVAAAAGATAAAATSGAPHDIDDAGALADARDGEQCVDVVRASGSSHSDEIMVGDRPSSPTNLSAITEEDANATSEVQPEPPSPSAAAALLPAAATGAAAGVGGAAVAAATDTDVPPSAAEHEPADTAAVEAVPDANGVLPGEDGSSVKGAADEALAPAGDVMAGDDDDVARSKLDQPDKSGRTAAAATAAGAAVTAGAVISSRKKKPKSSWLRAMCCAAPSAADDNGAKPPAVSKAPSLKSSRSMKQAMNLTKGVTGVVTGAVTSVAGAVTTVAGEAANISKNVVTGAGNVVTGAVSTVADGAVTLSKGAVTAVSTVTGAVVDTVGTVVTTTAGAVGTVVTTTAGAVGTVGGGIVNIGKGAADTLTLNRSAFTKPDASGGLLATPASWLFGASKMLQTQTAKALASVRLSKVSASAQGPPTTPQWIVVAGFTGEEAASELLPHFLAFAPPGSTVMFAVREGEELPEGLQREGTMEEMEEREGGGEPIRHLIKYRFLESANPTSRSSLAAAGLVRADAVLLSADASIRGNPAEADAQVLGGLLEIQHLLASHKEQQAKAANRPLVASPSSSSSMTAGVAAPFAAVASVGSKTFGRLTSFGKSVTGLGDTPTPTTELSLPAAAAPAGPSEVFIHQPTGNPLHIVACVATTASKAVAAAFFGSPSAAAAAAAGVGVGAGAGDTDDARSGVVGSNLFTYELLVPGEIEGAVLVQVANEPLYVKVVHEMLGSSEGCELYLITPKAFGFSSGEQLGFAEVQEVGRLLRKTAVGVVAGGEVVLVPDRSWKWRVAESDRIIAIADSW